MAQEIISNLEDGLSVRNSLNGMFTELYGATNLPLKIAGISAPATQLIPANSWIGNIWAIGVGATTPTVRIGTTPNGIDIMDDTVLNANASPLALNQNFAAATTFYITVTGGTASFRIEILYNFF